LLPLLSAGAIANVAATATAAPVPSAVIAATAAYFSAAVTTASMFQRFQLPLCFNVSAAAAAAASVLISIAIATIVLACRSFGASGGRWQRTP
jgi:protein-S-isoprenylcysteine O-methyltransferase Ste14